MVQGCGGCGLASGGGRLLEDGCAGVDAAASDDLLIGSVPFAAETVQKILAEPVAFLAINPRSLADIFGDIRNVGTIGGSGARGGSFDTKDACGICGCGAAGAADWRRAEGARLLRGLA